MNGFRKFIKHADNFKSLFLWTFVETLQEDLVNSSIPEVVKQLTEHEDQKVKESANALIAVLEDNQPVDR